MPTSRQPHIVYVVHASLSKRDKAVIGIIARHIAGPITPILFGGTARAYSQVDPIQLNNHTKRTRNGLDPTHYNILAGLSRALTFASYASKSLWPIVIMVHGNFGGIDYLELRSLVSDVKRHTGLILINGDPVGDMDLAQVADAANPQHVACVFSNEDVTDPAVTLRGVSSFDFSASGSDL